VKRQNEDLSRRFAIEGYPTILFLDPTGTRILGQLTYQEGGPGPWTAAASAILAKGAAK